MSAARAHDHGLRAPFTDVLQQQAATRLGMWLFLATELLFFAGLFVAYVVFRSHHPEIFDYGQRYLSTPLGAAGVVLLIVASLALAFAVRAARTNQHELIPALLGVFLMPMIRAQRLKLIIDPQKTIYGWQAFSVFNVAQLLNSFLPALGPVARVLFFSRMFASTKACPGGVKLMRFPVIPYQCNTRDYRNKSGGDQPEPGFLITGRGDCEGK